MRVEIRDLSNSLASKSSSLLSFLVVATERSWRRDLAASSFLRLACISWRSSSSLKCSFISCSSSTAGGDDDSAFLFFAISFLLSQVGCCPGSGLWMMTENTTKILVNCFHYMPEDGFELKKTVQLPKLITTPVNIRASATCSDKNKVEEDLNRKLKILKKIKENGELERLRELIEKWREVGVQVLQKMKETVGDEKVQRLNGRELAQLMGINDPKLLLLLFPQTSNNDNDDGSDNDDATTTSSTISRSNGSHKHFNEEFEFYRSSQ